MITREVTTRYSEQQFGLIVKIAGNCFHLVAIEKTINIRNRGIIMSDSEIFKVSSYQSLGACDGPSLRTVIFLFGCPLRCEYCHNPETWTGNDYQEMEIQELSRKIIRNKPYFKDGGGVTVSGGEPLLHQKEIIHLFQRLKEEEIHCCIDTSACFEIQEELLDLTDLFLVDIKFLSGEEYHKHTGLDIFSSLLNFLERCKEAGKPIWIRHVLYPKLTDNEEYIRRLMDFTDNYPNIQRIDLLPFKSICTTKYETLGINFPMKDVSGTDPEQVKFLKDLVIKCGKGVNDEQSTF